MCWQSSSQRVPRPSPEHPDMAEHSQALALEADGKTPAASALARGAEDWGRLRTSRPLLLLLGSLCLQSALFLAFAADHLDMGLYISFHLGVCAITAMFGGWCFRAPSAAERVNDKTAMVLQVVAWAILAGPFGTLIAIALLVPRSAGATHIEATTGQHSELTRLELLHGSLLDRRLRVERAHAIRPLLDVIIDGTQIEKFDALSVISKRYAPALAPALRAALRDRDGSVRVLASTVMAQQHDAFTKRIGVLQAIAREAPETSNHWKELGQAHLDYSESGLLETSRAEAEVRYALAHLSRAAALYPAAAAVVQARLDVAALRGQQTLAVHDLLNGDEC